MLIKTLLVGSLSTLLALNVSLGYAQTNPANLKEIATKFFDAVVNDKNFDEAAQYIDPSYIEHDPEGTDGPSGVKAYVQFLRENFPASHVEIKKTFVDGDYVIFHVHSILTPDTRGQAIIDIFKFRNGKAVEHWDITQDIPEHSANANGMF